MSHGTTKDIRNRATREVGFGGFLGTAYGYVGTSIYVVLGGVALYALGVTPVVLLLVGMVVVVTSWSYAEASTAMPEASGVTSFARRTLGPLPGFAAAWGLLLDSIILVAIAASFIPHYLSVFWPQLQDRPYSTMCGIGVVALLLLLNVAGLRESVRLSSLVTALGLATLVLLIAVGFLTELKPDVVARQISLGYGADLGVADLRDTSGGRGLRRPRRGVEPRRERPGPRQGRAQGHQHRAASHHRPRHRPGRRGALGDARDVQRRAGGHGDGAHAAGPRRQGPTPGSLRPAERPLGRRWWSRSSRQDSAWVIPAQEPAGDVYEQARRAR